MLQSCNHSLLSRSRSAGIYKGGDADAKPAATAGAKSPPDTASSTLLPEKRLAATSKSPPEQGAAAASQKRQKTNPPASKPAPVAATASLKSPPEAAKPAAPKKPSNTTRRITSAGTILPASELNDEGIEGEVFDPTSPEFLGQLNIILTEFWTGQLAEMRTIGTEKVETEQDFKNHNDLPLARIKRIMKSDEDVRMISAEAPVLFAKACEMFILDMSLRSWAFSNNHKRKTLTKEDVIEAIQRTDIFDFLVDVIH